MGDIGRYGFFGRGVDVAAAHIHHQPVGTVEMRGDLAHLVAQSYQLFAAPEGQIAYLATNGGDCLTAGGANVVQTPAPFFERAADYNQLSANAVAELDALYREKQMPVLVEIGEVAKHL